MKRKAVHVGVNDDAKVVAAGAHLGHDAAEILFERLRVVGEVARRLAVEQAALHPEAAEQARQHGAPNAVDGIHADLEPGLAHGVDVYQPQREHGVDVALGERQVLRIAPQVVHIGIAEVLGLGHGEHGVAVFLGQELALTVEQLERVPLPRVVARGYDYAAVGPAHAHGELCRGRRGQPYVHHVEAHADERAADYAAHHVARDAGITAYHDLAPGLAAPAADEHGVCRGKLNDVERVERVARAAAYGAAYA